MTFDWSTATTAFVTLLVVMDPLGNVPVFLGLTGHMERPTRRRIALTATLAAAFLVYAFAFFGTQILASLSIGLPALQIAGGVMLFLTALQMFQGNVEEIAGSGAGSDSVNVAIVPLGVPMLAGPGAIAVSMVLMSEAEAVGGSTVSLEAQLPVVIGIAATLFVIYLAMRYSLFLERALGDNGIHLVTRVMGMLLLAISVELAASGVTSYVKQAAT